MPGGWAKVALGAGLLAILVSAIGLMTATAHWWHRYTVHTRWPLVRAIVEDCRVDERRAYPDGFWYLAGCSVTFNVAGEKVRGGFNSLLITSGVDELRAWVAHHPRGSEITIRYDPARPQVTELNSPPLLFDEWSLRSSMNVAGTAAIAGILFIGIGLALRR